MDIASGNHHLNISEISQPYESLFLITCKIFWFSVITFIQDNYMVQLMF